MKYQTGVCHHKKAKMSGLFMLICLCLQEHREESRRTRYVESPTSSSRNREVYDPNVACPSRFHGRLQGRPHAHRHRRDEPAGPSHRETLGYARNTRNYVQEGRVQKHGRPRF